jgi:hypothetical protein
MTSPWDPRPDTDWAERWIALAIAIACVVVAVAILGRW